MGEEKGGEMPSGRGAGPVIGGPAKLETETHPEATEHQQTDGVSHSAEAKAGEHSISENSPWPVVLALGLLLLTVGLLSHLVISVVGGVIVLVALVGWMWQPWVS